MAKAQSKTEDSKSMLNRTWPNVNGALYPVSAYGDPSFRDQVAFSLLTLHGLAPGTSIRTIVFTDVPERFTGLAHEVVAFGATEVKADMGRFRHQHRVKIQILRRVAARFPAAVSWMLVDGDTVWNQAPTVCTRSCGKAAP